MGPNLYFLTFIKTTKMANDLDHIQKLVRSSTHDTDDHDFSQSYETMEASQYRHGNYEFRHTTKDGTTNGDFKLHVSVTLDATTKIKEINDLLKPDPIPAVTLDNAITGVIATEGKPVVNINQSINTTIKLCKAVQREALIREIYNSANYIEGFLKHMHIVIDINGMHPYTLTGDTIKAMYPQKINGDTMWVSSITISGNKLMFNCWLRMPTDKMNNFIDYGSVSILMHHMSVPIFQYIVM